MQINIVDCTLRDGGHLNNWSFSDNCIIDSYQTAVLNRISYYELGYIMQESQKSPDYILKLLDSNKNITLEVQNNISFMVMINAKNFNSKSYRTFINNKIPINTIRLACYPDEIEMSLRICEEISLNHKVFLNLMNASELELKHFKILQEWKSKNILSCLYFADSFGSMINSEVKKKTKLLLSLGYLHIGFHGHNNLQMALMNTIEAINNGCTYVDASIFGMGRGGGNLPIELLLTYLSKEFTYNFDITTYLNVINTHYSPLNEAYNWNYSYKNLLGGLFNIHPAKLDDLMNCKDKDVYNLIKQTKKKG